MRKQFPVYGFKEVPWHPSLEQKQNSPLLKRRRESSKILYEFFSLYCERVCGSLPFCFTAGPSIVFLLRTAGSEKALNLVVLPLRFHNAFRCSASTLQIESLFRCSCNVQRSEGIPVNTGIIFLLRLMQNFQS